MDRQNKDQPPDKQQPTKRFTQESKTYHKLLNNVAVLLDLAAMSCFPALETKSDFCLHGSPLFLP
jgi:hypothetical protein